MDGIENVSLLLCWQQQQQQQPNLSPHPKHPKMGTIHWRVKLSTIHWRPRDWSYEHSTKMQHEAASKKQTHGVSDGDQSASVHTGSAFWCCTIHSGIHCLSPISITPVSGCTINTCYNKPTMINWQVSARGTWSTAYAEEALTMLQAYIMCS